MRLAVNGNEDAFRRLYGELYGPVARFVRARVAGRDDAEDVTATVFRNFLVHLAGFDPSRGSVMTWVVTMARNAVVDYYRSTRPEINDSEWLYGVGAETTADARPTHLQVMIRDEALERIRATLERQPAEIREMFALRFEQGLSVREVAEVMGLSLDAAKQRYSRGFRKIQEELEEKNEPRRGEKPCAATD